MSKKTKQKKGFTIIEVVLVLAIAGLIFLMVFIVVPQAMAGQRDAERRQAMSRVQSALVQYQTNNKSKRNNLPNPGAWKALTTPGSDGKEFDCTAITAGSSVPANACMFIKNYMNSGAEEGVNTFYDPDGYPYNLVITENMYEKKGAITTKSLTVGEYKAELVGDATNGYTIGGTNPFKAYTIFIVPGAKCDGEYVKTSELRHFAVLYRLENSSVYCGESD